MTVPSPAISITCQEIYDQCRDYEDEPANMDLSSLVSGAGKDSLGGSEAVGITITLLDDWRLAFEARLGPTWVSCVVTGGNLVAVNSYSNNPISPTAYTQVQIRQSTSPSVVETGVSGLTSEESDQLAGMFAAFLHRQLLQEGSVDNLTIYEADGITPLYLVNVTDKNGNAITLETGVPAERSSAV
jgi:hypothetical protein